MANNRIFYPMQQIAFRKPGTTTFREVHGAQSVSISTEYNLEQAFQLSQLAIYENIEGVPDVSVDVSKLLDGYPPVFLLATASTADGSNFPLPNLVNRAKAETVMQLGIWPEESEAVAGAPSTYVEMSGLTVSSVSYNFGLEDNFTEDVTLVGNSKLWNTYDDLNCDAPWTLVTASGAASFAGNDDAPIGSGGVNRRENLIFARTEGETENADYTILPTEVFGVGPSGEKTDVSRISSITVSTDLSREDLYDQGKKSPYAKVVTFPVEVTCEIAVTSTSGDQVNAVDDCGGTPALCTEATNLKDQKIRIATCDGLRLYLGTKNKLSSVNYGGGDAGGGNVEVTYSYQTFNDFTVLHSGDNFNASGQGWWANRAAYLGAATQG
jgi:hypothetical protein